MSLGNQHQPVPQLTNNGWSGFYWGTSFGVGSASSSSRYRSVSHDHDEDQNEDTDVDVEDDGSIDISSNSSTSISDTTSYVEGLTSDDETNGALADLYLGGTCDSPLGSLQGYRSKARWRKWHSGLVFVERRALPKAPTPTPRSCLLVLFIPDTRHVP